MASTTQHEALVLEQTGGPLKVVLRNTLEPGPNQVLLEVKAVALNPVDYAMRDGRVPISSFPFIIGCDTAGIVTKIGDGVQPSLSIGTRALALATCFYEPGLDYSAFQQSVLAPAENVVPIPDDMSFETASTFPLAVLTAGNAYYTLGIPSTITSPLREREAILIWGAASSVGTHAVQSAKVLGFTVYATASSHNHEYIKQLGANAVFDYNNRNVVSEIVDAVKADGIELRYAHLVAGGDLQAVLDVLKATKGDKTGKIASSPLLLPDHPTADGIEVEFVKAPSTEADRRKQLGEIFQGYLRPHLRNGSVVASPPAVVVEQKGLEGIPQGLDMLKQGISAKKIVVSL